MEKSAFFLLYIRTIQH